MQKVLIVDAEQSSNHSLSSLLERNDFKVSSVLSAHEAIEELARNTFDLIISDLRLPDQPGTDLLHITTTPVLLLSTHVCTGPTIDSLKQSAINFISKPVNENEFLDAVQQKLNRDSTSPET